MFQNWTGFETKYQRKWSFVKDKHYMFGHKLHNQKTIVKLIDYGSYYCNSIPTPRLKLPTKLSSLPSHMATWVISNENTNNECLRYYCNNPFKPNWHDIHSWPLAWKYKAKSKGRKMFTIYSSLKACSKITPTQILKCFKIYTT